MLSTGKKERTHYPTLIASKAASSSTVPTLLTFNNTEPSVTYLK